MIKNHKCIKVFFLLCVMMAVTVISAEVAQAKTEQTVSSDEKITNTKKSKIKIKKYKIIYNLNKGENSTKNPNKYVAGVKTKLYKPTRRGYVFEGWFKDSKYKTKVKWVSKKQKGTLNLYAKWKPIIYKINYKVNGGVNSSENTSSYTVKDRVKFYNPTRENFDFAGWYLDSKFQIPITKISKGNVGDVTAYAKWTHTAFNINEEGVNNMIWSWWYYPNVVSYEETEDRVYWTFTTNGGFTGVAAYDNKTGSTKKTLLKYAVSTDDHNGAAVTVMDDGRLMCVYSGGHNADNELHVRISDNPEDISRFGTDIILESVGKACYGQIIRTDGKYYVFYRVDNTNWAYRFSEDGYVWSEEVMFIVSDMQYYIKAMPTTVDGIIRVCMYSNPAKPDCNIRMGFLNTGSNVFYNSDLETPLGTDNILYSTVDVIVPVESGWIQRLLDVYITAPEDVKILFATFKKSTENQKGDYKLYDNGQIVTIAACGNAIWKYMYQGGAAFIDETSIVLAREEEGYDYVEIYDYSEGTFTLRKEVYREEIGTINIRNARPVVDVNKKVFLWHRGFYDPTTYKNYNTEAKLYFMGE